MLARSHGILTVALPHNALDGDSIAIKKWRQLGSYLTRNVPDLSISDVFDLDGVSDSEKTMSVASPMLPHECQTCRIGWMVREPD
jgi:hypothetical protein